MPVIYVNDNNGQWHSERTRLVEETLAKDTPGRVVTQALRPRDDDYFIIKPRFSGFYATNLPVLLPQLGVSRLILTGVQLFPDNGKVRINEAGLIEFEEISFDLVVDPQHRSEALEEIIAWLGETIRHATPRTVTAGDVALYTGLYGPRFAVQSSDAFARAFGYPRRGD